MNIITLVVYNYRVIYLTFMFYGDFMINIVIATYNGEKYLKEQLDSILAQTYKEFAIYICDDNSNDGTVAIIEEYKKKYPGIIKFKVNEKNTGSPKHNFWSLIQDASECDYMMFCDQDDVWLKDKVKHSIDCIKKAETEYGSTTPVLFNTDLIIVDESLNEIHKSFEKTHNVSHYKTSLNQIISQNTVTGCTMVINKPLIDIMQEKKPTYFVMHDWWIELLASSFGEIIYSDEKTVLYRQHNNNTVGIRNIRNPLFCIKFFFCELSSIKQALNNSYRQAEALLKLYYNKLDDQQKNIIIQYINVPNCHKLKKIKILIKFGFLKNGIARKIAHILFV